MKIRIKGNTLRLRLAQSEVALLESDGTVEDQIEFLSTPLKYRLECSDVATTTARYEQHCIAVTVPKPIALHWALTEQVGISATQDLAEDKTLSILIEKDFKCSMDRGEDESDLYDPPS